MQISARIENSEGKHRIELRTESRPHSIAIEPKADGFGSSASGGELLFLALATCYCNDLYREAKKRNIEVQRVEVEVDGEFGSEGEPARNITYRSRVTSSATRQDVIDLMKFTDSVAEIQNTLRVPGGVVLTEVEAIPKESPIR